MNEKQLEFRLIFGGKGGPDDIIINKIIHPIVPAEFEMKVSRSNVGEEIVHLASAHAPDLFIFLFESITYLDPNLNLPGASQKYKCKSGAREAPWTSKTLELISHLRETYRVPIIVLTDPYSEGLPVDDLRELADLYSPLAFGSNTFQGMVRAILNWKVE